ARPRWPSSRAVAPPRPRPAAADPAEGSHPRPAADGGYRSGGLELEGRARVRPAAVRDHAGAQQLSELSAPAGLCAQAPQEAPAERGRGAAGELRATVRAAVGRGPGRWGQDLLRGRGPLLR